MEMTFGDVRTREIINLTDGKRLGHALDIVFDKDSGQVLGLTVPGPSKFLRKKDDIFIPMSKINKIGDDVILVTLSPNDNIVFVSGEITKNSVKKQTTISTVRFDAIGSGASKLSNGVGGKESVNIIKSEQNSGKINQTSFVRFRKTKLKL